MSVQIGSFTSLLPARPGRMGESRYTRTDRDRSWSIKAPVHDQGRGQEEVGGTKLASNERTSRDGDVAVGDVALGDVAVGDVAVGDVAVGGSAARSELERR